MSLFGAAYAAPNKGITILYWFRSPKTLLNPPVNGQIQRLFKAFECFSSTFQGKFYFQRLFKTFLYILVLFKPVLTLLAQFRIHLTWTCSWAVLVPSLCCIRWRIGWWRTGVAGTSRSWVTTWVARDPRLLLLGWVSCELSWVAWSWVLWCSTWVPWACVWIRWVTGSTHTWHWHRKWLTYNRNTRLLLFSTFTNQIVPSNCISHFSK